LPEAKASAIVYSIIETAKANNLNIYKYFYMVLLYIPNYSNKPKGIEILLTWNDFIKKHCSGKIVTETIVSKTKGMLPL